MSTKTKMALAALALISSASMAAAQYDGDGNILPGGHQQGVLVRQAPAAFDNIFAASRPVAQPRTVELDGDANPIRSGR